MDIPRAWLMPALTKSLLLWMVLVWQILGVPQCFGLGRLEVADVPDDDGSALTISWTGEFLPGQAVTISRATLPDTAWTDVAAVDAEAGQYTDNGLSRDSTYLYRLLADEHLFLMSEPVRPRAAILNGSRINQLLVLGLFFGFVLIYIRLAASGRDFFVRRISGLTAIEEAMGRATEMGRPVLYVPGIDDMNNIQTIANPKSRPVTSRIQELKEPSSLPT